MTIETRYICQAYRLDRKGGLKPDQTFAFTTEAVARQKAQKLWAAGGSAGIDLVQQSADPEIGEYGEPVFLARLGRVPTYD